MKKFVFLTTVIASLLYLNIGKINAQESSAIFVIEKINPQDSLILTKSRPHEPRQIPAPKFVLKTKNNNFMMTIGGWANAIVGYDFKNQLYKTDAGISFIPADIPLTTSKGEKSDFYINPVNGVVFFQIVGLAGTKNEISAFIKLGIHSMTPWVCHSVRSEERRGGTRIVR